MKQEFNSLKSYKNKEGGDEAPSLFDKCILSETLNVKPEVHDVAVFHNIGLSFNA